MGSWHSYKLYLGREVDRTDQVIARLLPLLADQASWFYVRYSDEQGIHLRCRFSTSVEASRIEAGLADILANAPLLPRLQESRLVTETAALPVMADAFRGIVRDHYDGSLELDKYVDERGLQLVEAVFSSISDLASKVLRECVEHRAMKKHIGIAILAGLHAQLSARFPGFQFSESYASFAAGKSGLFPRYDQLAQAAEKLAGATRDLIRSKQATANATAAIEVLRRRVDECWQGFEALGLFKDDEHRIILAFDILHRLANALGFSFSDETYIALLVHHADA